MNAYLFSGVTTRSQVRPTPGRYGTTDSFQTWDACGTQIVFGDSPQEAQKQFETWLHATPDGENPVKVTIRKIAAAQFIDRLFTESGETPLNWNLMIKQVESQLQSEPVDDFEQGYWVDVDQVVRPDKLSFSAGTLKSDVPEDIRSGLNWLSDKKFLFVLSVLSPLPPQAEIPDEPDTEEEDSSESSDENAEKSVQISIGELYATFPQALDKEVAALIQARNSVVAAWLWRRYAANTRLATNAIRIVPWCGAIGLDAQ